MTHANGTSYILSSVYVAHTNCICPFNIFLSLSTTIVEFCVTVMLITPVKGKMNYIITFSLN